MANRHAANHPPAKRRAEKTLIGKPLRRRIVHNVYAVIKLNQSINHNQSIKLNVLIMSLNSELSYPLTDYNDDQFTSVLCHSRLG